MVDAAGALVARVWATRHGVETGASLRFAALKAILQELARDEVQHARIGWAYLAWAKDRLDLSLLSGFLPAMASGATGPELFQPSEPGADDPGLLRWGVVPKHARRRIYLETLDSVVIPGFEQYGVATGPLRAWAEEQQQAVAALDA